MFVTFIARFILFIVFPLSQAQPVSVDEIKMLRDSDLTTATTLAERVYSESTDPKQRAQYGEQWLLCLYAADPELPAMELAKHVVDEALSSDQWVIASNVVRQSVNRLIDLKAWDDVLYWQTKTGDWHAKDTLLNGQKAELSNGFGRAAFLQGHFKEASNFYERALNFGKEKPSEMLVSIQVGLGAACAQQGEYDRATSAFLSAVDLNKQLGLPVNPTILMNIGSLYFYLEQWEKAVSFLEQAAAATDPSNTDSLASIYSNIGAVYAGMGDLDKAFQYYNDSYLKSLKSGKPNGNVLNNMGVLLRDWGRFDEALERFESAAAIYGDQAAFDKVAVAYKNMGETLMRKGDFAKARILLRQSYELYADNDLRPKRLELFPVLIENLENLGDFEQAFQMMKEFVSLQKEDETSKARERIAALESAVELAKKESQLAESERDRALQASSIANLKTNETWQKSILLVLFAAALLLVIVVAIQYRQVRFKSRANEILATKNVHIEKQAEELAALNQELQRQSVEDALTGLKNRRYLTEFMRHEAPKVAREMKQSDSEQMLLIIADIDHFKRVNDVFGHHVGDHVLRFFADVLRGCKRESDVVVRWGGEEFLWVCRGAKVDDGPELCERVRAKLRHNSVSTSGDAVPISCSLGFAPYPLRNSPDQGWEWSLKLADHAMYQAKREGRDGWFGFGEGQQEITNTYGRLDVDKLEKEGKLRRLASPRFGVA